VIDKCANKKLSIFFRINGPTPKGKLLRSVGNQFVRSLPLSPSMSEPNEFKCATVEFCLVEPSRLPRIVTQRLAPPSPGARSLYWQDQKTTTKVESDVKTRDDGTRTTKLKRPVERKSAGSRTTVKARQQDVRLPDHPNLAAQAIAASNLSTETLHSIATEARQQITRQLLDGLDSPARAIECLSSDTADFDQTIVLGRLLSVLKGYKFSSYDELESIVSGLQRLTQRPLVLAENIGKLGKGTPVYLTAEKAGSNYPAGRMVAQDISDSSRSARRVSVLPLAQQR
jgi:hypothetical protein